LKEISSAISSPSLIGILSVIHIMSRRKKAVYCRGTSVYNLLSIIQKEILASKSNYSGTKIRDVILRFPPYAWLLSCPCLRRGKLVPAEAGSKKGGKLGGSCSYG